jgi:hypothetical protein
MGVKKVKADENSQKSEDEAPDLQECEAIPSEKEMSSHSHHKRVQVNEHHRASRICIKKADVEAGSLKPEQEARHEPVKEHDVFVG